MTTLRRTIRGIRDRIPPGYVVGREKGDGQPQLLKINSLVTKARGVVKSIQTLLDSIGSTRGSILYRGASGWAARIPSTFGYFLMDNGPGADPTWEEAGFVPSAAAFHPGFVSGRYYTSPFFSNSGTDTLTINRLYAHPFYCPADTTFTEIAFTLTTVAAGKSVRLGIYDNVDGKPVNLEYDAGSISVNATTGQKAISGTFNLSAGWHWLCMVSDGAPVIRNAGSSTGFGWMLGMTAPTDGQQTSIHATHVFGTLPSTFPAITYANNTTPQVTLRL